MSRHAARFIILNTIGGAGVVAMLLSGMLGTALAGMSVWLVAAIAAGLAWGLWRAWCRDWPDVEMVSNRLPMLGLIGAVVGMVQMFGELKGIEGAADGLALLGPGAATALMSTAMGIAGSLWLDLNARVLG